MALTATFVTVLAVTPLAISSTCQWMWWDLAIAASYGFAVGCALTSCLFTREISQRVKAIRREAITALEILDEGEGEGEGEKGNGKGDSTPQ